MKDMISYHFYSDTGCPVTLPTSLTKLFQRLPKVFLCGFFGKFLRIIQFIKNVPFAKHLMLINFRLD
jgi:hypothetical protein